MRYVRLEAYEDELGELGLIIKGTPKTEDIIADRNGGLLAHDLLEHQQGLDKIGCCEDELIALGAVWQVRGRWGDFLTGRPLYMRTTEALAVDVSSVWDSLGRGDWWPGTKQYHTRPHDEDDAFDEILAYARSSLDVWDSENGPDPDVFLADAKHLLRIGYRLAHRRFGHSTRGYDTFRAVRDAVARCAANPDYEGQEFILAYGDGRARCYESPAH